MASVVAVRAAAPAVTKPRRALVRVAMAAVLANSTWFSATAVVAALQRDWHLSAGGAAWLVVAVQAGFITGSIAAALLNLPDRLEPRRLIAGSAIAAAAANALLVAAGGLAAAIPSRFLVGVALAGVYAPGVRLVATHYARGRGVATGVVVGALTLGSATPHLVRGLGEVPWPATILTTSVLALLAAAVIRPVTAGLDAPPTPLLNVAAALRALRARPVRLTTFGYLGHMWELYAFWAWLPMFVVASRHAVAGADPARLETGAIVFAAVGVASLSGAILAGRLADRLGRTTTTSAAMVVSAACCLVSPWAYVAPTVVLVAVLLVWGASVIADSAQFSASVTELAEPRYAGSALTLQLALGFALTIASIRLVPVAADAIGWRFALVPLAVGPLAGTAAMVRLRTLPAARRLAHGRR
jgi:MFS family permease